MEIHLIWAQDYNGGIGKNGQLPWHVPEDLKNFKKITVNSTIIMGRKTWDSLPFKPLPKRRNIVLSHKLIENVEVYHDVKICIDHLKKQLVPKVFIIGGSSIYKLFFNYSTHLHITYINIDSDSIDTFFPFDHIAIKENFIKNNTLQLSNTAQYTQWIKK